MAAAMGLTAGPPAATSALTRSKATLPFLPPSRRSALFPQEFYLASPLPPLAFFFRLRSWQFAPLDRNFSRRRWLLRPLHFTFSFEAFHVPIIAHFRFESVM